MDTKSKLRKLIKLPVINIELIKYDYNLDKKIDEEDYKEAANYYNEAIKYTCDGCYVEFGGSKSDLVTFDLNKYLVKADTKSATDDNIKIKISGNEYDVFSSENNSVNQSVSAKLKQDYSVDTNKEYTYNRST